jgi:hypothetical protein
VYSSLAAAVAGSQTESFTDYTLNRENGILIGIISLNKNASVGNGGLVNTNYAVFNLVSKFGELLGGTGGLSTTTLQQAYDNSTTPEIVINSTLDGVTIKNGTGNADNVTNLLEGQNAAGTTTSFIRADGAFSGTSIYGTGLTATTISATTYHNLPYSGTINNIPKWISSTGLTDSTITDDGTNVTIPNLIISTSGVWSPAPVDTYINEIETLYPLYVDISSGITQSLNEGFVTSQRGFLNNTFITILNDQDHRAIKIFYYIVDDTDTYYRSGDSIANWDNGYTTFRQTEYGPVSNQPLPNTIDAPTIQHGGIHTEVGIYVSGTYTGKCTLKIKYTLL